MMERRSVRICANDSGRWDEKGRCILTVRPHRLAIWWPDAKYSRNEDVLEARNQE